MNKCAILVNFHKYQNYGAEFYEPILTFFLQQMQKYKDEYDTLYLLDSTWGIHPSTHVLPPNVIIIKTDPNVRYFDTYKKVLPDIKEDLVLLLDNDMVIYKPGVIKKAFNTLEILNFFALAVPTHNYKYDVVSIYDTIGTMEVDLPDGKNKFCPYFFATRKDLLMKYLDVDWSPDAMPYTETFGLLTEAMLKDGLRPFEFEEDKSNILFDGTQDGEKSKDLGYYHIRAGSTPAVLLAYREHDLDKYWKYMKNQPRNEYLRQMAWYDFMGGEVGDILGDLGIHPEDWLAYYYKFREYHGL